MLFLILNFVSLNKAIIMTKKHLRTLILFLSFMIGTYVNAQNFTIPIPWNSQGNSNANIKSNFSKNNSQNTITNKNSIPHFLYSIKNKNGFKIESIDLTINKSTPILNKELKLKSEEITSFTHSISKEKKDNENYFELSFPVIFDKQKIQEVDVNIKWAKLTNTYTGPNYPNISPLKEGRWYKIKTLKKGVYKITGNDLSNLGLNIGAINPQKIKIFGQNNGMLPELNYEERPLGLHENAIEVFDGGDNSFDNDDYILFYSAGPDKTYYDSNKKVFQYQTNIYADEAYYFLNIDLPFNGKRIPSTPSLYPAGSHNVTTYDAIWHHEKQSINLDKTGREWFGEKFDITDTYNFNINSINREITDSIFIEYRCVANNVSTSSNISFKINNNQVSSLNISPINTNAEYPPKANQGTSSFKTFAQTNTLDIKLEFDDNGVTSAYGYIDYILLNYRSKLNFNEDQTFFRDYRSHALGGNATFNVTSAFSDLTIWNITDHINIERQILNSGKFTLNVDELQEFIAFSNASTLSVSEISELNNQNLHGISQADYILIYHPKFRESAMELKEFHEDFSNYSVAFVSTEEIYNEFSSGRQDLAAIRDFIGMIYHRNLNPDTKPKAVLLFGDASYDYKDYNENNSNFVPTWEDQFSLRLTNSNATDDFIVCMDSLEGNMSETSHVIDIPVGRLVVQTNEQGQDMVDKIKAYKNFDNRGPWQSRITLVTDDVDEEWERNGLIVPADGIITKFYNNNPNYNLNKVYTDSYQQTNSSGGQRYPEVERDITEAVNQGSLIVHYYGHGGEAGWATERILDIETINSWDNNKNLPAFVTTTCEFTRYDDLTRISAGEYVHLNPNGGAIALFTSTRQLNIGDANLMSRYFYDNLNLKNTNGNHKTMGELLMDVKESYKSRNTRRFILVGDPGITLNYPEKNVNITTLNEVDISSENTDTLKALSKISIQGEVVDIDNSLIDDFNGVANIQIFDKIKTSTTLNNDNALKSNGTPVEPFNFSTQTNKVFKGEVAVTNGKFKVEFIVPKDIDYNIGNGRISVYAKSSHQDAWGNDTTIIVGSIISNPQSDNQGPDINLYMNDVSFISGGITNKDPDIYAILHDTNGINAVGTGVGHDISAIIDEESSNPIILNDFYQTFPNSFTTGDVRYPLQDLAEGEHTLSMKAWDNYNNSNSAKITFFVTRDERLAIFNVGNIPNPFSDLTDFQFEHNHENQDLNVKIEIFNTNGVLVKTIEKDVLNAQSRVNKELFWEGDVSYGNPLSSGLYLYRLSVQSIKTGQTAKKSEKLVIIK